jgi:NAD(P)-dependent dehydrogenase (short-subunit alcohol dehydrogenase family)
MSSELKPGRLAGKVVIVTGASAGAGAGCARAIADEAGALVLVSRTKAKLDALAAELTGVPVLVHPADVSAPEAAEGIAAAAVGAFGRLDGVVNAAQSPDMRASRLLTVTDEEVDELWASGPKAVLRIMRACHPHLKAAGGGSVVNFVSGAIRRPAGYGMYGAVKSAIETLGRAAAAEWGPDQIRVNSVVPLVMSPALELDMDEEQQRRTAQALPLRRLGRPRDDIGRTVAFLLSEDAAYLTGSLLLLDGGSWSAR